MRMFGGSDLARGPRQSGVRANHRTLDPKRRLTVLLNGCYQGTCVQCEHPIAFDDRALSKLLPCADPPFRGWQR